MSEPVAAGEAAKRRTPVVPTRRLFLVPRGSYEAPKAPFVALVIGLLVAALLCLLVLNTQIASSSFAVASLQARNTALDQQQQALQQQVDSAAAPGNLSAKASKLGMVPAGVPAFIRLPDGKVLGSPAPAVKPVPIRIKGVGPGSASDGGSPSPKSSASASPSASPGPKASRSPGASAPSSSSSGSTGGQQVTPNLGGN